MAASETARLVAELTFKDGLSAGISSALKSVGKLESRLDKIGNIAAKGARTAGRNIERGIVLGAVAATGAIVGVVKAASDYESAFAGVRKTVDATEPELQKLSEAFREMSRTIPISAAELARLGEAGGALGIATKDLTEFVRITALLGVTTDLSSDQAADSLGVLANVLHLTSEDFDNFGASLVALGNAGASTESAIIEIAKNMGAAGEQIGLSTAQVLGFASAAASLDPTAVEAFGTALQQFFQKATGFVSEGGDKLKLFAKTAGQSAEAFKKAFDQDAGAALQDFLAGLGKLDKYEQSRVLDDLGLDAARMSRLLTGLANNTELVAGQLNIANTAFEDNTALTKEATERFKTFDSQLAIFKNNAMDAAITIGTELLPELASLAKEGAAAFRANQPAIRQFAKDLAAGLREAVKWAKSLDWEGIGNSLKTAAMFGKGLVQAFLSMPDWVKTAVITGWGLNKLTGGAVTGIIGELGKGLIKGVLGMNAGVVNARAGVINVAGGVPGAGVAGAAGGGKVAGALNLVTKVLLVGMAAEAAAQFAGPINDLGKTLHVSLGLDKSPLADFGAAWDKWRATADWPFGQKNAPEWAGGPAAPPKQHTPPKPASSFGNQPVKVVDKAVAAELAAAKAQQAAAIAAAQAAVAEEHRRGERETSLTQDQIKAINSVKAVGDAVNASVGIVRGAVDASKAAQVTSMSGIGAATKAVGERQAAAIGRAKLAVDTVARTVNQAKGAIDTVRAATNAVKSATDRTRDAVGAARAAIKALKLNVQTNVTVSQAAYTYLNGRQLSAELDRSTTVVRGTSAGQTVS